MTSPQDAAAAHLPSGGLDSATLRPTGALLAAQIAISAAIDREAVEPMDYDATTLDLLVRLDLAPSHRLRAVELCRQLQLSPSHISRMIDRAERLDLVRRGADPNDRRAKSVGLTDRGHEVVAAFAPRLHAIIDEIVHQTLSPDEVDTLVGYLERLEDAAAQCTSPSP